jgi:ribosomal protein L18
VKKQTFARNRSQQRKDYRKKKKLNLATMAATVVVLLRPNYREAFGQI